MKVAVLGAAGTIAPAIVRDLSESEEVESILLLDLDAEQAEAVAAEQGDGKAEARRADARDGLSGDLRGSDMLVNSASYRVNLDAMRACLEAGCHYLDLGGLYRVTGKQLLLHADFVSRGLVAILGIGSSPGKTNLMAAHVARELTGAEHGGHDPGTPGSAAEDVPGLHSCDVAAAGRDLDPPAGLSLPYALETLLDELTLPPVVLREGEPLEVEPLSPGGEVDFGDPIGRAPTICTLHSELLTFGDSFGCREASFRLSLAGVLLERLRELASATEEEVRAAGREAGRPSPRTVAVHLIEATGGGREARMRAVTQPHTGWGLGGGIVSTAAPAAATVRLLTRGEISARGVLPPERSIEPEKMFAELEERGTTFELEVKEEAAA